MTKVNDSIHYTQIGESFSSINSEGLVQTKVNERKPKILIYDGARISFPKDSVFMDIRNKTLISLEKDMELTVQDQYY